jgi:uncharacterized protein YlxP (DUF503 family)
MVIGLGTITLHLPAVHSLKEKRSVIKSVTARLHHEFNVSCSEVEYQDVWQSAGLGLAVVSNDSTHAHQVLEKAVQWVEYNRPDVIVMEHTIEMIS